MDLVIDANILFAALIKRGITSELVFLNRLYAPEFIFVEFRKYKGLILSKTERTEDEFEKFMDLLERRIILVPQEEIFPFLKSAEQFSPDTKDVPYLALALKLRCAVWSNDKPLKEKQKVVKIYSTSDLVKMFSS
ncbi:MAG: PIN domain-containing protein [Candidatus Nanoarchaeia archaeon]|nr:PIN domain-containing protein [Candidatus Nanoarchaeia archaeon]MDD5239787.1 PIN domain-containing protein [Candidatus Nanoarchaeia archaeon]